MKAVVITTFGSPEGMHVVDLPTPEPADGQVLIRTEAIGVGGVDAVIRRGTLSTLGLGDGYIPGSEVAGTVVRVGGGVDARWLGRQVWAFPGVGGGYVEYAIAAVDDIVALTDDMSSIDAVTIGSAAVVAYFALQRARFTEGESVLVRGAAGSIGLAAVELAYTGGASSVTVTTSSTERGDKLRALGASHVLDREGNGDGPALFDVIIDVVAGQSFSDFIDRMAVNGRLVMVGIVGGPPVEFGEALMRGFRKSLTISSLSLDTIPTAERDRVRAELLTPGVLHPVVADVLPLDAAPEAHRRMDNGTVFGRIVLVP